MKRGDIFLASAGARAGTGYAGKPRPVIIVQADALSSLTSVLVVPLTTSGPITPYLRLDIKASEDTGLAEDSRAMVDKVVAIPTSKLGPRLGELDPATIRAINRGLATVLGLGQRLR